MRAMLLESPGNPLKLTEVTTPTPQPHQVLLQVRTCGICRTDLHIVDGELPHPALPLIMGHQIVGTVLNRATVKALPGGWALCGQAAPMNHPLSC